MFFKDKNGIQVCQLGTGDIKVSEVELEGIPVKECVGVVFGECEKGKINRTIHGDKGKLDYEAGMKFKLLFTNPKSIDVVIKELQQAKELMGRQ